jgi:PAS domain S-box-containing protein
MYSTTTQVMCTTTQSSDAFLHPAVRAAKVGLWDWDLRTNVVTYSAEWKHQLGYAEHEISDGLDEWENRVHPDDLPKVRQRIAEYRKRPWPDFEEEFRIQGKDGSWHLMLARAKLVMDEKGSPARMVGCHIDISRYKLIEVELSRVNRALRLISGSNLTLVQLGDEGPVLEKVCRLAVEVGGYKRAWVGFAKQDERKTVHPAAQAGFEPGYFESVVISWSDEPQGRGPAGTAIRTGRTCISRNIPGDPTFDPWRDAAAQAGYQSAIALPLRSEGQAFGTLIIYAAEVDAFGAAEVKVLEELASDLTFGITAVRTRAGRDRAGEALKESQRKLEAAQRIAHVGHWERDLRTDFITWSDEIYRIFGTPLGNRQMSFQEFLQMIHPDDRPRVVQSVEEAVGKLRHYSVDYKILRADGEERFVHSEGEVVRDDSGRPLRAFGTVQDITERKQAENALRQSESKLRLVIDTIPAMAWIVLPTGALAFINQRWLEYSGLSLEEAIKEPTSTMHPEDIPRAIENWNRHVAAGEPYEEEMRLRRADGEYRWFLVRTVPLVDELGNIIEWYGTSTDIEDQKRAEEALRETQALLARVARASVVGELTASIAHEVNQPLGGIVTNAEAALTWLSDDAPNLKEAREALQRIVRDGTRASEVVARIRSLLKNGKPNKIRFNLDQVIREIIALTKCEARRRQVSVQTRFGSNLPQVTADRVQVQQVLMNLVMNSLDALSGVDDRPRVLRIQADKATPKFVRVAVQDTGIGIDPQRMKDIFVPFHTTKPNGLGLGLSISRSIIEAHGGRLRAIRNDGPGATFQFTLPVERE